MNDRKSQDLTGRVALVTGASRGIGRATALALANAGADVALNYHSRTGDAEETRSGILGAGRRAILAQGDVSQQAEVARVVDAVERDLGPVTILVNNAGITRPQP